MAWDSIELLRHDYAEWLLLRRRLSAWESGDREDMASFDPPVADDEFKSSDWGDSDDVGITMLERAMALLEER